MKQNVVDIDALLLERTNYIKTARDNYQLFYNKIGKLEQCVAKTLKASELGNICEVQSILQKRI